MTFDATFWVAVSFFIFFGALIYLKIPGKINELLGNMITGIKKEIDESEKLRAETKVMLDEAQKKLDSADKEVNKILKQAKDESEKLVIEMNEKFHNSSEIKKKCCPAKNYSNERKCNKRYQKYFNKNSSRVSQKNHIYVCR